MWDSIDWLSMSLSDGIVIFKYLIDRSYELMLFVYFISWAFAILQRFHIR